MAGYIIVDVKTKKIIAICSGIAIILFIIGILIGYFSGHTSKSSDESKNGLDIQTFKDALKKSCHAPALETDTGFMYMSRYLERRFVETSCRKTVEDCLDFNIPRNYIAYHLNGKQITFDGKLDEDAWLEVPWSEKFVDMRSTLYPAPYLDTKFKMRWDSERLYVGAYIQEKNLWATATAHDSPVYQDNGFEMLLDVDGTMFNYKQVQINVFGTMMDQILYKSPYDSNNAKEKEWHPQTRKEVYYEGTINTPADVDRFWSVEMSFTFKALKAKSMRAQDEPSDNEVWFVQFGRSEQKLNVTSDGKYYRIPKSKTDWWAWQPCDAINLHLQDRWGLVQFKKDLKDKAFGFQKWHIYKALFDMMNAMKTYKALNGKYIDQIEELDVPPYLLTRTCVEVPEIKLLRRGNETDFDVTVRSRFLSHKPAHIRSDRYVTFE